MRGDAAVEPFRRAGCRAGCQGCQDPTQVRDRLARILDSCPAESIVIVGMGQVLRGDDGAGPALCERIRNRIAAHVIDVGTIPENYTQPIMRRRPRVLLIVDATDFGGEPGAIALLAPERLSAVCMGTHGLSPRVFIDVLRRQIDVQCRLVAIQPMHLRTGIGLSNPVRRAVDDLARWFIELLG